MAVLGRSSLEKFILEKKLVENYKSLDEQLTANGIDFRLAAVIEIEKSGTVTLSKEKAKKPIFGKAWVLNGYEQALDGITVSEKHVCEEGTPVVFEKNKAYLVVTCEKVNTPENMHFKIEIRTSLFRLGQCVLETGFGEAGYRGVLTALMYSLTGTEVDLGVRFCQVAFYRLDGNEHYEKQKETNYQGGKIL